jgi:GH15 family glucan-1,4-alpha-glucosidase
MNSAIGKKYLLNPFDLTDDDSESRHQIGVIIWCDVAAEYGILTANIKEFYELTEKINIYHYDGRYSFLKYIFSVPNGGMRSPRERVKLNREGVKSGVEDLALDVARHSWHGLRIEMKGKNGVQSKEQKEWQKFHLDQGYYSVVCYSFIEARDEIVRYLKSW